MSDQSDLLTPPESPEANEKRHSASRKAIVFLGALLVTLLFVIFSLVAELDRSNSRISVLESRFDKRLDSDTTKESSQDLEIESAGTEENLFQSPTDVKALIARVGQSVVEIECADGGGTGFALDIIPEGVTAQSVLVTNYHVIDECWEKSEGVTIRYGKDLGQTTQGTIVRADSENDLALIEIDVQVPFLKESETFAERGWWTMAIGNPLDAELGLTLERYVTFGYIGYVHDNYWNYTSATLNRGNSGGPLVNSRGELIGINTLASSGIDNGIWNIAVDSEVLCFNLLKCDD